VRVQGKSVDAEKVLAGGGGFGNQVDQHELTSVPDAGDPLDPSLQVQSPSLITDFGTFTVDSVIEAGDADDTVATADLGDRAADEGMLVDMGRFGAVAEGFFAVCAVALAIVA